jgi:tRNA(Ile)-lysidine synthase
MGSPDRTYENSHFWIACSGGLDSVFAVRIFHQLNIPFGILHCNFNLRGQESDQDEQFVRSLAIELGVTIRVKSFDVKAYKQNQNVNTQLAARQLRYTWFEELIKNESAQIVLGHHRDDQRETFMLQLLRGASVHGLACMPSYRNGFLRPFLHLAKEEIQSISLHNNWKWRDDSSNLSDQYARNDLRLNLIPLLNKNEFNWSAIDDLISGYQELLGYLKSLTLEVEQNEQIITISEWLGLPKLNQNEFLEDISFGKNNIDLVNQLATANKGAYALRNGIELWNEGEFLLFRKQHPSTTEKEYSLNVERINKTEVDFNSRDLYLDEDKINGGLYLRKWRSGDAFVPLGMCGKKKISDFLKDKKVLSSDKESSFVVLDGEGIVGVVGYSPAERVKISSSTKQIIKVSVELR